MLKSLSMRSNNYYGLVVIGLLALMYAVCSSAMPVPDKSIEGKPQRASPDNSLSFVHAQGRRLVRQGVPLTLRAICFSNYYNYDSREFDLLNSNHHSEKDFERVKTLGFNSIRFAFNGNWYRDNPQHFWAWLDRNVALARKYDLMLVLDLHSPIGGFWLDPTSPKLDFGLWDDPALQQENVDLWQAIAKRYRDEPHIAAYDVLNEPVTNDSTGDKWRLLAERLVAAIREVDDNHLIIIERLYGVNGKYGTKNIPSQFLVKDNNVMYDFHFYEPLEYTHQFASWVARPLTDGGHYPDSAAIVPTGRQRLVSNQRILSETLVPGDSSWRLYQSKPVTVTDPQVVAALPIMVARGNIRGNIQFDNLKVVEYAADGRYLGEVFHEPLNQETIWQWWDWERPVADQPGKHGLSRVENDGSNDDHSLAIALTGDRGIVGWSSEKRWFRVKTGHSYQVIGYMKGQAVEYDTTDAKTRAGFELDFYAPPLDTETKPFLQRDREYLEQKLIEWLKFGVEHNVPMSVMEFGLVRACFEMRGKGGSRWINDMLSLFRKYQLSFAYWNYHGNHMGLYLTDQKTPPGSPNEVLMETLLQELSAWRQ